MIEVSPSVFGLFQVQEDLTEEKKRELEHNAEETYGENDENVCVGCAFLLCVFVHVWEIYVYSWVGNGQYI